MNILIIGHARHGKDTVAEFFHDNFGMKYTSSSLACAKIFIYDALKDKYGYTSFDECYADRVSHREEWYNMIVNYNKFDKTRLAKEILRSGVSCYVGMRDRDEILACREDKVFDLVIWVDASERLPLESDGSFNISKDLADFIIDNNQNLKSLESKLTNIGNVLFKDRINSDTLKELSKNVYGKRAASTHSEKVN
jgi:dephospho-CoA kinase